MPPPQYGDHLLGGDDHHDEQDPTTHIMNHSRVGGDMLAAVTLPKVVGVIGGMGPMATSDFMAKVVEETEAPDDQCHMPMMVMQW